ncbi:MAG: response regulator transcription factor [Flavobacteriales bacterium]|nr:response regulator transcription factor [Flavobacteriales bacterium]
MQEIKVLIADDHQLVIEGIRALLADVENITVVGEAVNGKDCFEKLASIDADVVLMDMDMPIMSGIDATRLIAKTYPNIKVLALTMYNEKALITKMLEAGTVGYMLKNIGKEELQRAITTVNDGEQYFSSEIPITLSRPTTMNTIPEVQEKALDLLTPRELEILVHIAEGLSNSEIGKKLFISSRTVDTHRTNLMKKLDVHNVAGLIRFAIQNDLIK